MLDTPYGDRWFMPSTESYVVRLITDAGGDYIYKKNTGNASTPIDFEEAIPARFGGRYVAACGDGEHA